jgi:acyl-CoA synthetase (AMP-forming)/AMP-acid ligase II
VASGLRRLCSPGDRALLLFASGLDFIAAFFGCLYAGVVAVPAYPPRPRRDDPRLWTIGRNASPWIVLTTSALLPMARSAGGSELSELRWLAIDLIPDSNWQGLDPLPSDLAFLQYTSGSTASPRGLWSVTPTWC